MHTMLRARLQHLAQSPKQGVWASVAGLQAECCWLFSPYKSFRTGVPRGSQDSVYQHRRRCRQLVLKAIFLQRLTNKSSVALVASPKHVLSPRSNHDTGTIPARGTLAKPSPDIVIPLSCMDFLKLPLRIEIMRTSIVRMACTPQGKRKQRFKHIDMRVRNILTCVVQACLHALS